MFVEKPVATKLSDCKKIESALKSNNVKLMIGHNFRFHKCVEELKKIVEMGSIGDIKIATFEYVCNGPFSSSFEPRKIPDWYFNKDETGFTVWFTGLPCSGKSTIADAVAEELRKGRLKVERLDADIIRKHLWRELGYSKEEIDELFEEKVVDRMDEIQ